MKMQPSKILIIGFTIVLFAGIISLPSIAAGPTPPPVPTPTPPPSSGGGGGSSGGGSAPVFQSYTIPLKSSDGTIIGNITGRSAITIILRAVNTTVLDGMNYTVTMDADMGQRPPDDATLDMNIRAPNRSGLPRGMDSPLVLGVVDISRHSSYGWNVKSDTVKLTFTVPDSSASDAGTIYYIVRYDGSSYHIQAATLKASDADTKTFEVFPSSETGLFTVIKVSSSPATPTPVVTPTTLPTSTSTPTPIPTTETSSPLSPYLFLVGIIVCVIVAILAVIVIIKLAK
ncbi:hypothetical protein [Methanocella sp.]|uniref:hypothetical protein n=1 Tax=Methanocella sp. TaxID=2052833 RepID=UPI002D7E2410|nr:hypothetical protein [Methanocella sp.]